MGSALDIRFPSGVAPIRNSLTGSRSAQPTTRLSVGALSVLLLVALATPATGAGRVGPPLLVEGAVSNAAGKGVPGQVLVFHDNLRDHNRLELVASTRASQKGRYAVRMHPTAEMDAAGSSNSGYANFVLFAATDAGMSEYMFFAAQPTVGGAWADDTGVVPGLNIRAERSLPHGGYLRELEDAVSSALVDDADSMSATSGDVTASETGDDWLRYCMYDPIQTLDRQTPVAELHTRYTDLTGRVHYGRTATADSSISVGVRAGSSSASFSASGTTYVGNTQSSGTARTRTGTYGKVLASSFKYQKWRYKTKNTMFCSSPPAPYEIIEAIRWNGTTFTEMWDDSHLDGKCRTTYNNYKMSMGKGDYWYRWNQAYTAFGWNLSVSAGVTASMTARSGASTKVGHEYWSGTARSVYYLCGNTDYPAYARRILAGH